VKPFLDKGMRGVFATRAPRRPNPIGLSVVKLLWVEGCALHIEEVDVVDGTPPLDIKPYVPKFDVQEKASFQKSLPGYMKQKQTRDLKLKNQGKHKILVSGCIGKAVKRK
jgi:tRNA (Thr-GGU) A37 N-methylase